MDTAIILNLPFEKIITLIFYIIAIIYLFFTVIMRYHWKAYSVDDKVTHTTLTMYYITTIPLVLLLGFLTLVI